MGKLSCVGVKVRALKWRAKFQLKVLYARMLLPSVAISLALLLWCVCACRCHCTCMVVSLVCVQFPPVAPNVQADADTPAEGAGPSAAGDTLAPPTSTTTSTAPAVTGEKSKTPSPEPPQAIGDAQVKFCASAHLVSMLSL